MFYCWLACRRSDLRKFNYVIWGFRVAVYSLLKLGWGEGMSMRPGHLTVGEITKVLWKWKAVLLQRLTLWNCQVWLIKWINCSFVFPPNANLYQHKSMKRKQCRFCNDRLSKFLTTCYCYNSDGPFVSPRTGSHITITRWLNHIGSTLWWAQTIQSFDLPYNFLSYRVGSKLPINQLPTTHIPATRTHIPAIMSINNACNTYTVVVKE